MRTLHYWTAFLAIILLGACKAEEQPQNQVDEPLVIKKQVVLSAYSSDDVTKSSRDASGNFFWSPDDAISVFYGSGSEGGARFESTLTESAPQADFTGTIEVTQGQNSQYWAIYPYNENNACDGQKLTTVIPSSQVAAEGTFADGQFISIGRSDDLSMGFYHLCGGIKFFLKNDGIAQITLKNDSGAALAGTVEVVLDEDNHPNVQNVLTGSDEIVLTPPEGETSFKTGTEYFFVTKPVTFEQGFTVTFVRTDGLIGTRHIASTMTIRRAKFQWSNLALDTGVYFIPEGMTPESYNIENDYVLSYMTNVDYTDDTGYTYSSIYGNNNYLPRSYRTGDQPKPISLEWSGGSASKVILSTTHTFETESTFEVSASSSPAKIYNLIPGLLYYYQVKKSDGSTLKSGCFIPEGPVRMIYIGSISDNIRDLGGWKAGNKTIRYGRLYRGALIDNISSTDKSTFIGLGIGLDMELRGYKSDETSISYNTRPIPEIDWCQFKLLKFLGVTETAGKTEELYRAAIKKVITYLRENENKAVYFHCAGGADRTGALAFLIEALLGVSESDMSKDFELTSMTVKNKRYRHMSQTGGSFTTDQRKYPYKDMIMYLRDTYQGATMQEKVTAWATTGENALTSAEIEELKALLLE